MLYECRREDEFTISALYISCRDAQNLNVAVNYQVTLLLLETASGPLLPYEIKPLGYEAERILSELPELARQLFILIVLKPTLREPVSHLLDAYWRLEEGDIEGARTSVRKALECLEEVVRSLEAPKESIIEYEVKDFPDRLRKLIKALENLVAPGGPHPGPAPRTTTEMVLEMMTALVKGVG